MVIFNGLEELEFRGWTGFCPITLFTGVIRPKGHPDKPISCIERLLRSQALK
jgi:polynucleotide 5'-kinase involved in rRNA processing